MLLVYSLSWLCCERPLHIFRLIFVRGSSEPKQKPYFEHIPALFSVALQSALPRVSNATEKMSYFATQIFRDQPLLVRLNELFGVIGF